MVNTPSAAALDSLDAIKAGALACFVEHGYHGTVIREIAARSGLSVPGLYYHFESKHHILVALMRRTMDDLYRDTHSAVDRAGEVPVARLAAAVGAHVRFHTERREESFVGNTEIRSLVGDARDEILALRDRQQRLFDEIVTEGARRGDFSSTQPHEASRAIVTMSTAVATWFRRDGLLTPEAVADQYAGFALRIVGADPA